jgi:hypothetical protein
MDIDKTNEFCATFFQLLKLRINILFELTA